jgi:hypothetical protein
LAPPKSHKVSLSPPASYLALEISCNGGVSAIIGYLISLDQQVAGVFLSGGLLGVTQMHQEEVLAKDLVWKMLVN